MKTFKLLKISAIAVALSLAACSPKMHPEILKADKALALARATYQLESNAPRELSEAESAVQAAKDEWKANGSEEEAQHLSYVAGKRVQIATIAAQQNISENATKSTNRGRAKMINRARTLEADQAKRKAEFYKTQAEIKETQAELMKNQ